MSFRDVPSGYGACVPNVIESERRAADVRQGPGVDKEVAASSFSKLSKDCKQWSHDAKFAHVVHEPSGPMQHHPKLLRGGGIPEGRGCLYDRPWKRLTVEKMSQFQADRQDFYVHVSRHEIEQLGASAHEFQEMWVMCKQGPSHFDHAEMLRLLHLYFPSRGEQGVREQFPTTDGALCLDAVRTLLARYTIVARYTRGERIVDLGHNGMKKGITEHTKFAESLRGANFGSFGGQRAPKAEYRNRELARGVAEEARVRRVLSTPLRKRLSPQASEEAPALPIADGPQTPIQGAQAAENLPVAPPCAAQEAPITSVASASIASASSAMVDEHEDEYHVQCDACWTWRQVPKGLHDSMQLETSKFFCRVAGQRCGKKRRCRK
jgi:hypothetical protein